MQIKTLQRYKLDNEEFKSLEDIKDHVIDKLGEEVVNKLTEVAPLAKYSDVLKMVEVLKDPKIRKVLNTYLNITYSRPIPYANSALHDSEDVNILDY